VIKRVSNNDSKITKTAFTLSECPACQGDVTFEEATKVDEDLKLPERASETSFLTSDEKQRASTELRDAS